MASEGRKTVPVSLERLQHGQFIQGEKPDPQGEVLEAKNFALLYWEREISLARPVCPNPLVILQPPVALRFTHSAWLIASSLCDIYQHLNKLPPL